MRASSPLLCLTITLLAAARCAGGGASDAGESGGASQGGETAAGGQGADQGGVGGQVPSTGGHGGNAGNPGTDAGPASNGGRGGAAGNLDGGTPNPDAANNANPGCGKPGAPPAGMQTIMANGKSRTFVLRAPATYVSSRAYPLVFGFHGASRSAADFDVNGGTYKFGSTFGSEAILAYPNALPDSAGTTSWSRDTADDLAFFDAMVSDISSRLCVNRSRIFVAGHSSGGFFSNVLACKRGNAIRAIAPVAGGDPGWNNCVGKVAAFVVHGKNDNQVNVSNGIRARDHFIMANGCTAAAPQALDPAPCVAYAACQPRTPVAWCEHLETEYSNTSHGWPTFATAGLWKFWQSLAD